MSRTSRLRTKRDLSRFVADLETKTEEVRSLEDYLETLWHLGSTLSKQEELPLRTFTGLLEAALREPLPALHPSWFQEGRSDRPALTGHQQWERTILEQIVDLHEMTAAGSLGNDLRYFGIDSPRGAHWYNFDPFTFLECAVAGTFEGGEINRVSWATFAAFLRSGQCYE